MLTWSRFLASKIMTANGVLCPPALHLAARALFLKVYKQVREDIKAEKTTGGETGGDETGDDEIRDDETGNTSMSIAIWLLASHLNHSCVGNCSRTTIGDMMIVRAATDLPAGTELLAPHTTIGILSSYDETQESLADSGITCDCEVCKTKKATTSGQLEKRKAFSQELKVCSKDTRAVKISLAKTILEKLEKTYPATAAGDLRFDLRDPYITLGYALLLKRKPAEAIRAFVRSLEVIGYRIVAPSSIQWQDRSRFEVEKWGVGERGVADTFFAIHVAYKMLNYHGLCGDAKKYVKISYRIAVGEDETVEEAYPNFF